MARLVGTDKNIFRKSYMTQAIEMEVIERLYPNQSKDPHQKYRLTEKAKEWKTNNQQK